MTVVALPELTRMRRRGREISRTALISIAGIAIVYIVSGIIASLMVGSQTSTLGQSIAFGASGVATLKGAAEVARTVA